VVTQQPENQLNQEARKRRKDMKSSALSFVPRLMDLETAAAYLSLSYWTVRSLVQAGKLQVVEVPRADAAGEPIRRVLIDRQDLDEFVDSLRRTRRPD
jgi:hypothetical protein